MYKERLPTREEVNVNILALPCSYELGATVWVPSASPGTRRGMPSQEGTGTGGGSRRVWGQGILNISFMDEKGTQGLGAHFPWVYDKEAPEQTRGGHPFYRLGNSRLIWWHN